MQKLFWMVKIEQLPEGTKIKLADRNEDEYCKSTLKSLSILTITKCYNQNFISYCLSHPLHKTTGQVFKCNESEEVVIFLILTFHIGKQRADMAFKCKICEKAFTDRYDLKVHIHTHTRQRLFKCDECEKVFTLSHYLRIHEHIHSEERPFKCDECPKAFRQSQNLKKHKGIHTGERPFKCDECPKAFRQSQNLKKHKGIHTGERPFKCDECPKAFR